MIRFGTVCALLFACLWASGCRMMEIRVGQAKVPEPVRVTPEQIETQRQAADYLERTVETPSEAQEVARALSDTVGAPVYPQAEATYIVDALYSDYRDTQREQRKRDQFLTKHAGGEIEGTGVDLAPWGMGLGTIILIFGIVALGGAPLLIAIGRLSVRTLIGAFRSTSRAIDEFKVKNPDGWAQLKPYLSTHQDSTHKSTIARERQRIS